MYSIVETYLQLQLLHLRRALSNPRMVSLDLKGKSLPRKLDRLAKCLELRRFIFPRLMINFVFRASVDSRSSELYLFCEELRLRDKEVLRGFFGSHRGKLESSEEADA